VARGETNSGYGFDSERLDRVERRFWREIWDSVSAETAAERGIELREFGPVQTSVVRSLPNAQVPNLVLGAADSGAVAGGVLAAALDHVAEAAVAAKVPVTPGAAEADAAVELLRSRGYEQGYAWMKFVRDAHPPRFPAPGGVEVAELSGGEDGPFGMIAATGFGLPAWAAAFFANLPGKDGWRCYMASVEGTPRACAAMLVDGGIAEFGIAATLESARGRGCQRALLRRRIADAAAAGCDTLFVETGERIPGRPSASYRNILRAGFEEAYLRPNWSPKRG
jgi:GNAT superfamily N-acetyltransferase